MLNRNIESVLKENQRLKSRNFEKNFIEIKDAKVVNLNPDVAKNTDFGDKENFLNKKIKKLKKNIEKRKDKNFRKKLNKDKKKRNVSRKVRGIKGMRVTPKLEFKKIPDALNATGAPLDASLFMNTNISSSDPRMLRGMNKDIMRYLKRLEVVYQPSKDFLKNQKFVTKGQRERQVDWILRLSHEMRLKRQSFYLAVSMMDRYIELRKPENDKEYDCIALTCLFSAAKYEELTFPTINDFVYLSGGKANKEDLIQLEMTILETLGWRMNHCNPMNFFDQLSRSLGLNAPCYHFGQFLVECLVYKGEGSGYKSSVIGASCLLLCLMFYDERDFKGQEEAFWRRIEDESLYTKYEVYSSAGRIWEFIKGVFGRKEEERSAVMEKFKKKYYSRISKHLNFKFEPL